jgi:ABC-type transport system involved in cytochrome c biogenesis permease component
MLQCCIKETTNIDILKPKVMKLTYIRKITFNINGTIIHSALAIPLINFLMNSKHEMMKN